MPKGRRYSVDLKTTIVSRLVVVPSSTGIQAPSILSGVGQLAKSAAAEAHFQFFLKID